LSLSITEFGLALTQDDGPERISAWEIPVAQRAITPNLSEDGAEIGQRPSLRLGSGLGPFYHESEVIYETLNSARSAASWRNTPDQRTQSSLTRIKIRRQCFQRSAEAPQFVPSIVPITHVELVDRPKKALNQINEGYCLIS
jgi:hypothetical protein